MGGETVLLAQAAIASSKRERSPGQENFSSPLLGKVGCEDKVCKPQDGWKPGWHPHSWLAFQTS
jgi:hypothetical protein